MPRNGSGTYTLPQSAFVPSTTISSSSVNSDLSDIASALTASISADGQTPITGPLRYPDGIVAIPSISFTAETTTGFIRSGTGKIGFVGAGVLSATLDTTQIGTTGNQFAYGNTAIPVPVGAIQDFAGAIAPTGWLLCGGQVVAQATYPELFTVCSTTYNTGGEGAGNFRIPDCRGRTSSGKDNMGGSTAGRITVAGGNFAGTTLGGVGGSQNHTQTITEMPSHNHIVIDPGHFHNGALRPSGNTPLGGLTPGSNNLVGTNATNTDVATTDISLTATGSGAAFTVLSPTIIFNKIIFAGRP